MALRLLHAVCRFWHYAAGHTAPPDPGEGLRLHFGQLRRQLRTLAWIVGLQIRQELLKYLEIRLVWNGQMKGCRMAAWLPLRSVIIQKPLRSQEWIRCPETAGYRACFVQTVTVTSAVSDFGGERTPPEPGEGVMRKLFDILICCRLKELIFINFRCFAF